MFEVGNEEFVPLKALKKQAVVLQRVGTTKISLIHKEGNSKKGHLAAEK